MLGESLKGFTLSRKQLLKRYRVVNPEFMNEMFLQNKSVMALGGHYGNIEWGKVLGLQLMHPVFVVFSPFTNSYVNNYNVRAREKYGVYILPVTKTLRVISERKKKPTCYMVGVDQRAFDIKNAHWTNFLNQDTPCHTGYAQIARRFNLPLVFINIQYVKRGYYTTEYQMLHPEPATLTEAEIVELFMKMLEKQIRVKPQNYLWSHKRWKFQRDNQGHITKKY
jgi:KDO2-lipid IV(A) lauroyltransferase